jgi:ATP-dependent DNA helicase PIF1
VYLSVDTPGEDIAAAVQGDDVLNQLNPPGLPPHKLTLKPGMPGMIIRNLHSGLGLVNGTRFQVSMIHDYCPPPCP